MTPYMKAKNIPWRRVLAEGVLIVASVLIAISLESAWQARQNEQNAKASLREVLNELEADKSFLEEVVASQQRLRGPAQVINEWLRSPDLSGVDSLNNAFREFDTPMSMWPRNHAWSSMVSANQLSLLGDRRLVLDLGEHYQFSQERIVASSRDYDLEFSRLQFESIPRFRNLDANALQALQAEDFRVFGNQVLRMMEWNAWYLDVLSEYGDDLDTLIESVRNYLIHHGEL
ncbi:MAG: hypothetical protein RhofKO_07870 [Rhodothermales bacterium]